MNYITLFIMLQLGIYDLFERRFDVTKNSTDNICLFFSLFVLLVI